MGTDFHSGITVFLSLISYMKSEEMGISSLSPKTNVKYSWQMKLACAVVVIVYIPLLSIVPDQGPSTDLLCTSPKGSIGKCKVFSCRFHIRPLLYI